MFPHRVKLLNQLNRVLLRLLLCIPEYLLAERDRIHLLPVPVLHLALKLRRVLLDVRVVRLQRLQELGQVAQCAAFFVVFNDSRDHAHCAVDLRVFQGGVRTSF